MKSLNIIISLALVALAIISTSCATPPRTFHNDDNTALVIESLDNQTCRMLRPDASVERRQRQVFGEGRDIAQKPNSRGHS